MGQVDGTIAGTISIIKFVDWSVVQENLVGRRLKVRWAKGTLYENVVVHHDAAIGRHRVLYKDGDVRDYILSKKKIRWLRGRGRDIEFWIWVVSL